MGGGENCLSPLLWQLLTQQVLPYNYGNNGLSFCPTSAGCGEFRCGASVVFLMTNSLRMLSFDFEGQSHSGFSGQSHVPHKSSGKVCHNQ